MKIASLSPKVLLEVRDNNAERIAIELAGLNLLWVYAIFLHN